MKPKTGVNCAVPGGNRYIVPEEETKPPDGFIDSTVKLGRIQPDGSIEYYGTMPPFPENAEKFSNFKIKKEVEEMRGRGINRIDWTELWEQVVRKANAGLTNRKIADQMNVPVHALRCKVDMEKRKGWVDPRTKQALTENKKPDKATKPTPAKQEPAPEIIAEETGQVKETDVPEDEVVYDFTKEDKPTQYKPMEVEDATPPADDLERQVDEQIQSIFKAGIPEEDTVQVLSPELYMDDRLKVVTNRVMTVINDPIALQVMREMFERMVI